MMKKEKDSIITAPWTVPWGTFGLDGSWTPNPLLSRTASQQMMENIKNGYLPSEIWKN